MLVAGALTLSAGLVYVAWQRLSVTTTIEGVEAGEQLRPDAAAGREVRFTVRPASSAQAAEVRLDGVPAGDATIADGVVTWKLPADITVGEHTVSLTVDRPVIIGRLTRSWTFTVDASPPAVQLAAPQPVAIDAPVVVEGTVEAGAALTANGEPVAVQDGRFQLRYDFPPPGPVTVVATDAAGNATTAAVLVAVLHPEIRAVHVRAEDWANPDVRAQVLGLVDTGAINAVQLDIKDENGIVGYDSQVSMARDIGATRPHYVPAEALGELHARGARVIGRIVAFRDPLLANAAWKRGYTDAVLQDPNTGRPLEAYGGFTNYVNPVVREYNLALAVEAAELGFDEILWDYVRRPEGAPSTMFVPGLGDGSSADHIVSFLAEGHQRLRPLGVRQGASVFGIAATRPLTIAQDVARIALHVDYLAPMLYPSHWNKGEYNVPDPGTDPYAIVKASLQDFQAVTAGTQVALAPWLQDFDDPIPYGPDEVAAQVRAAQEIGVTSYLLWNPTSTYSIGAAAPEPEPAATGG